MTREEALKIVKENMHLSYDDGKTFEALKTLVPELRESEDERIRKEMIAYFQDIKEVATKSENLDKWIAYLEKQKEQNPAEWSEEDNERLNDCLEVLEWTKRTDYEYDIELDKDITWLRILPERLNLTPNKEWSEEDEKMLNVIIGNYRDNDLPAFESDRKDVIDWLKSLRPQPHWKPSEEQMKVFGEFVLSYDTAHEKIVLNSLYNDLKKL